MPLPKVEKHRTLPAHIRQAILDVKREHPPLNFNQIRTICWARFNHCPSSATVKRVLAEAPPPPPPVAPPTYRAIPPHEPPPPNQGAPPPRQ